MSASLARRLPRALLAGLLVGGVLALLRWAWLARPLMGGDDFHYYVCVARDLASGASDVPRARWHYFPGAYAFWRAAWRLSGGELAGLQTAGLAALLANAALVGVLVARHASVPRRAAAAAGVWAALVTVVLASRLQGLEGETEPLATLPALAGLLLWGGAPLRGRAGAARALGLGLALGVTLAMKQQGLLLWAGLAALGLELGRAAPLGHSALALTLGPLGLASGFLGLVLLEGEGLSPLALGLQFAGSYAGQGSFLANLVAPGRRLLGVLFALALAAAAGWLAAGVAARRRGEPVSPRTSLAAFSGLAALAAFVQLARRDYAHYALLAVPFATVAATLGALALASRASRLELVRRSPLAASLLGVGLAALPLVGRPGGDSPAFFAFPLGATPQLRRWRDDPRVVRDLERLRAAVRPGEELAVVPARHNEVHLALGTRARTAPVGYGWEPPRESFEGAAAVLVVQGLGYAPEREGLEAVQLERVIAPRLEAEGFERVSAFEVMTLYRRR